VVTLSGEVDRKSDAEILTRMTRELDGVVEVVDRLSYRWDDTAAAAVPASPFEPGFRAFQVLDPVRLEGRHRGMGHAAPRTQVLRPSN
jgi:hypothetical protein